MTIKKIIYIGLSLLISSVVSAQSPNRVGTTTANFLEIGYGARGVAMGDALTSITNDISSVYWNAAGIANMKQNQVAFSYQPWLVNTNTFMVASGMVLPGVGTLALNISGINYGEIGVTSLELQEGTGESFTANDFAVGMSYGRKLANWFSFGLTTKYINSSIWHTSASAFAADFGVIINTPFFSPSKDEKEGLTIGMSLQNYGTRMSYEGLDLLRSIDIAPDEAGNYKDVKVNYQTDGWELPLIFRVGLALHPIVLEQHRLTVAVDALHVNNNSESVNLGAEYSFWAAGFGTFFLRGGYKALFLKDSEYGFTFGAGMQKDIMGNKNVTFNYAFRDLGLLGYSNSFTVGLAF